MSQETFAEPTAAYEFGSLVDKVGGARAREVLIARQSATGAPTLRAFTREYLDSTSGMLTGIEQGTRDGYKAIAERAFLPILGDYPLDAIDKDDIGRWVAWQEAQPSRRSKGQNLSSKTIKNYHALLSSILAAAVDKKIIDRNPAHRTRLPKGTKREAVFLSPEEFNALLHFIPVYYKPLVYFLVSTGIRWGEATALTWADLNLTTQPATVRVSKAWKKATGGPVLKHPKSSKARRTVAMHAGLVAALGTPGARDELVFPGRRSGKHLWHARFTESTWKPAVEKAMDKDLCAKLGLTPLSAWPNPHDLRHTHASWLIAAGVPLPYIQARLGHEKITTTVDTYGHLVPDAHEKMSNATGTILAGVSVPGSQAAIEDLIIDVIEES